MEDDLRKSLIVQLKNSFEPELPDVAAEPSLEGTTSYVHIGDLSVPKNEVIEAIDYFTKASDKLAESLEPQKVKRAGYCDLAGAALSSLLMKK